MMNTTEERERAILCNQIIHYVNSKEVDIQVICEYMYNRLGYNNCTPGNAMFLMTNFMSKEELIKILRACEEHRRSMKNDNRAYGLGCAFFITTFLILCLFDWWIWLLSVPVLAIVFGMIGTKVIKH